jgi:hypothetical protein
LELKNINQGRDEFGFDEAEKTQDEFEFDQEEKG